MIIFCIAVTILLIILVRIDQWFSILLDPLAPLPNRYIAVTLWYPEMKCKDHKAYLT